MTRCHRRPKQQKGKTMNPLIQLKQTTSVFLIAFGLTCFGLSPAARAIDPAPDGGYPFETTGEGQNALFSCGVCNALTAIGFQALFSNTAGQGDAAIGSNVLPHNTTGNFNTAAATIAVVTNPTGQNNTAVAPEALENNITGNTNTAVGDSPGINLTSGSTNLHIGNPGEAGDSNTIRLGHEGRHDGTAIAGIYGATVA